MYCFIYCFISLYLSLMYTEAHCANLLLTGTQNIDIVNSHQHQFSTESRTKKDSVPVLNREDFS